MTTSNGEVDSGNTGALTTEQAAEIMRLAESGDTSVLGLDFGAGPTSTTAEVKSNSEAATGKTGSEAKSGDESGSKGSEEGGKQPIPEGEQTADNTVVLARDGKHTIDFEHLTKARQQRDEATARATAAEAAAVAAQTALKSLQDEAAARAAQGQAPTKMDNLTAKAEAAIAAGADPELFGDFSEEALKAGVIKLVTAVVPDLARAEVDKALAPIREKEAKTATNAHEAEIFGKYPNALSIVESTEFKAYVDSLPKVAQNAVWGMFDAETGGTAAEIVEVLDAYTKATATDADPKTAGARLAAAKAAFDEKREPPLSLSGIPGGHAGENSKLTAMAQMDGQDMYAAMENMTPQQIESFLNKQL